MIKEKELPKAVVSNKLITHKATDLTIMSYDKNVHKLIIPTDLTQAEISDIIVLITFRYHKNIIQISGELVEDKIEIILPNEIRSLSGEFYIEIDINLTDNRQITFARYHAKVVKSDIDSVDLDDAQEFYFELFDDFVQKVADNAQQAKDAIDVQTVGIEGHANASKQTMDSEANSVSDYGVSAKNTIDTKVDSVELAKTDALTAIDNKVASVTTAKQSALTSIAQATSDVTDASTQFTADLADTQSTIDAQVTQAQDSLQEVSDTLIAVNDKAATVNDTADAFVADVADKSQLVDDKYQQFDTSVTQAGQTIDDILGLADDVQQVSTQVVEKANKAQEAWITPTLINGWYAIRPNEPPQYMKDEFGFVHFRGAISKGASATSNVPFQLPLGYRPNNATTFSMSDIQHGSRTIALSIFVGGNVDFAGSLLNSWYGISSITFKAV